MSFDFKKLWDDFDSTMEQLELKGAYPSDWTGKDGQGAYFWNTVKQQAQVSDRDIKRTEKMFKKYWESDWPSWENQQKFLENAVSVILDDSEDESLPDDEEDEEAVE